MATASTTTPTTTTATASTVTSHLVKTRVDLLLGLSENLDEITRLLGVCCRSVSSCFQQNLNMGRDLLSVVKNVMAVPLAPARPVRPIRCT